MEFCIKRGHKFLMSLLSGRGFGALVSDHSQVRNGPGTIAISSRAVWITLKKTHLV